MSTPRNVAVIGLGMIGGSVARGLAACGVEILGYDTNNSYVDAAVAEGVVARRISEGFDELSTVDAVVLAVYGDSAAQILEQLERHAESITLVTDVGSTKRGIVSAAEKSKLGKSFVGSHPFAGDHRSGWFASRFDLFENEIVYLCPTTVATPASYATAQSLWTMLGAKPVKMDAVEHDELLAWTSHLPHIVSCALGLSLAEVGIPRRQLGRGGRDVARLAAGSPEVWTSIAMDNSEAIVAALSGIERQIASFRELVSGGDRDNVRAKLSKARDWSGPAEH